MRVVVFAALLLAPVPALADAAKPPAPEALTRTLEELVAPLVEHGAFSGVVLVARGDDVLFERAWGLANAELGVPNRLDTRFRIASVTKRFTAIVIAQLEAEKKLSENDPLSKWAPSFPGADRITIAHLRSHRSGIREPEKLRRVIPASYTAAEVVALLAKEPLGSEPGQTYSYTTANYAVLSFVIEKVTGTPFAEAVRRRVYVPAGMTDAGDIDRVSVVPRLASGYMPDPFSDRGLAVCGPEDTSWKTGGGSGYATGRDLFRFQRALAAGRLLPAGIDPATGFPTSTLLGRPATSLSGAFPGANAAVLYFPGDDLTVVVLSNNYASLAGPVAQRAAAAALGEPVAPLRAPGRAEPAPLDPRLAGVFRVEGIPHPVTFETRHGRAVASWNAARQSALLKTGDGEYFMPLDWATLKVRFGEGGTLEATLSAPWNDTPRPVTRAVPAP